MLLDLYFKWLLVLLLIFEHNLTWQVDRVYLGSPNVIAVLDHEKKRTYLIRKEGLPDAGKLSHTFVEVKPSRANSFVF